jgi:hypothetical protein
MKPSFALGLLPVLVPALMLMGCGDDLTPDTTPPLAPIIGGATGADGEISVWWQPNTEADLAGYHCYVVENGVTRQVNENPIVNTYVSADVNDQGQLHVFITAVDFSRNESSPSATRKVNRDDIESTGREPIDGLPTIKD